MTSAAVRPPARPDLFLSLAYVGAHLAFMPLFVLLLPRRAEAIAGAGSVGMLSAILLAGGITASVAHIAAGAFSDRWFARFGSRRGVIALGVVALLGAYAWLAFAHSLLQLGAAVVAFQLALNLMFAPLGALLADHVEDSRKGRIAALMNAALPLSGLGTALLAFLFPSDDAGAFVTIAIVSAAAVIPLLVLWPFSSPAPPPSSLPTLGPQRFAIRDYGLVWCARLSMQLGAAFLFNYFYLFLAEQGSPGGTFASRVLGLLTVLATGASVGAAISAGRWSDSHRRRRGPMIAGALTVAAAFILLASGTGWPGWVAGFILFNAGLTAFLSIDSALVAQLLAGHRRRGELLGYMNLTNTLPAILVPIVTLAALDGAPRLNWALSFAMAGLLALGAALLVAPVRAIR